MACYDIFNGDADGICALQQLRLQFPREAQRISGLKRDIDLLQQVDVSAGDEITILDVSLDKNRDALVDALTIGARVFYADHHYPGEIPDSELLDCHIDVAADTCTSLIINKLLDNAQARWAVVGAYGDNFDGPASQLGESLGLGVNELADLQQLGICLNYNGYGFELGDLMFHPVELFGLIHPYNDPRDFIENETAYAELLEQFQDDMARAQNASADSESRPVQSTCYPMKAGRGGLSASWAMISPSNSRTGHMPCWLIWVMGTIALASVHLITVRMAPTNYAGSFRPAADARRQRV